MDKHTPGPWDVEKLSDARYVVTYIDESGNKRIVAYSSNENDAKAIASLPKILGFLKDVKELVDSSEGILGLKKDGEIKLWSEIGSLKVVVDTLSEALAEGD